MKLLILGGTQFLGRYLVMAGEERNHQVTLFNRGRTNPDLFPKVEKLRGERGGKLDELRGRTWDAVIDTSGFTSTNVRASAEILKDSVRHYTFISSISVYSDFSKPGLNESASVQHLLAGAVETEGDASSYGARKALCEQACEEEMPGRVLNIRPGLIIGPHATDHRFTYWIDRAARMEEVLAPGNPNAPIQLIDVPDLAKWILNMVEVGNTGTFNAVGSTITFSQILESCISATGGKARSIWAEEEFLLKNNVAPFSDLPLWIPSKTHSGFYTIDGRRAFANGLKCRDIIESARDVALWKSKQATSGVSPASIGLDPVRERDLLKAWLNRTGDSKSISRSPAKEQRPDQI